ncbi:MAG TPA: holdfast anchoring protein HfaA [Rhizomicrobium sp.]|nr:holdfast anchoring protein HfaA [Rhizomicrobium sp.]
MTHSFYKAGLTAVVLLAATVAARADGGSSASDYNNPYGMTAGQSNQAIDPSLRDANGNLSVVNGVFTSSNMGGASTQQMSSMGAVNAGTTLNSGGVGFGGGGVIATSQAIGNSLNVVTVGTGNTVIVNSHQTNNGDQNATTEVNGQ